MSEIERSGYLRACNELLGWAGEQWENSVKSRPAENIYRNVLDNTWQSVRREIERRILECESK